ncbi:MAG: MoaD/ThiS family protein [Propioniciclava sp.]
MQITFYAGAADAAGTTTRSLDGDGPLTAEQLLTTLAGDDAVLATVLSQCSLLVDGISVAAGDVIAPGARVDVLPPFAGG